MDPIAQRAVLGSAGCNLHAHGADLDLTLLLPFALDHGGKQQVIQQLALAFEDSNEMQSVEVVTARVPIVRLIHMAERGSLFKNIYL